MDLSEYRNKLIETYKYKIEMHAHTTPASTCSQVTPQKMVDDYVAHGYSAVVIANHYIYDYNFFAEHSFEEALDMYYSEFEKTLELGKKQNLNVILASEIRFTENVNDYLVYGIDKQMLREIYELLPYGVEAFRKNYSMPNSVFIQAHPFRDGMTHVDPLLLDGIETMNLHQGHNSRIAIASRYASQNPDFIVTTGSDYHHPGIGHEAASAMRFKFLPKDSFELASLLKSKDYIFEIGDSAIVLP